MSETTITSTADLAPDGVAGYTKAIYGGIVAGLTALGTAYADGQITGAEWIGIAIAVVLAGGGVYGFANKVKPVEVVDPILGVAQPPKPDVQP
jgi:hypothetical protein